MIRGRELQAALPAAPPVPTPPAVPSYVLPGVPPVPAAPTAPPPVVLTAPPPVLTPSVAPPVVPPVASAATSPPSTSAAAPAPAAGVVPDTLPPTRDRFITGVNEAATYFEDVETKSKHIVRNGCQICSDPKPCENPVLVTEAYLETLTLKKDFECDMMHDADVHQGVAPGVPAPPTTPTLPPTTTAPRAAELTTTTTPEPSSGSFGFGHVAGVLILLVLCCVGAGAALSFFNGSSDKGRSKKTSGKGGSGGSAKKGKRREESDQAPLLGQHAPTLDALSGQQLHQDAQLPDTLQALAPMPPVPPMHLQRNPQQQPQQQEHAPTITSLQQMPHPLAPSESFLQMQAQPPQQLAPTMTSMAPPPQQQQQQQQQPQQPPPQPATALAPTTMALGQLPAELMSPQAAAALAMPTTQAHNHYPQPAPTVAAMEYDVVTVTPDGGFSVIPYAAGQGAM